MTVGSFGFGGRNGRGPFGRPIGFGPCAARFARARSRQSARHFSRFAGSAMRRWNNSARQADLQGGHGSPVGGQLAQR
jgi:hypothetical protein